jgi:hypothetical protein
MATATKTKKVTKTVEVGETLERLSLAPLIDEVTALYYETAEKVRLKTGTTLPNIVVVINRDDSKKGTVKYGHITTAPAWATTDGEGFLEIVLTGEGLKRGGRATAGTLLHEMAHAYNIAKGVKDVDSNGRHNKKFKDTAEQVFGLTITEGNSVGWSLTEVSDECAETWADMIARLERAISLVSCVLKTGEKEKKRNSKCRKNARPAGAKFSATPTSPPSAASIPIARHRSAGASSISRPEARWTSRAWARPWWINW